jgi:hypothetical protein
MYSESHELVVRSSQTGGEAMKYFSKLMGMFSKSPESATAPSPAPVAEPMVVDVPESDSADAPSIDGD